MFKELFFEAVAEYELSKLDEYVSGQLEDKIFNILKTHGFDCSSNEDEIVDFLSDTSKLLKYRDIVELAKTFFEGKNCDRHLLQKVFNKKRKEKYKTKKPKYERGSWGDGEI